MLKRLIKQILKKVVVFIDRKDDVRYYWRLREKALASQSEFMRAYYCRILKKICNKFNSSIGFGARIANMPTFPHGLNGIFITGKAVIGSNCVILQQVTIGFNSFTGGAPVIGDNVFIGAGAMIIGAVKVGNNVRIGANCVVVKDIPENGTVVLPPARIIEHAAKRKVLFSADV